MFDRIIKINNVLYNFDSGRDFAVGDLVLDSEDGCYGFIVGIGGDYASVRDNDVVELGVPLSRLLKLKRV